MGGSRFFQIADFCVVRPRVNQLREEEKGNSLTDLMHQASVIGIQHPAPSIHSEHPLHPSIPSSPSLGPEYLGNGGK